MTTPPRILAIAGSDSSGGAGIQADIKTITMLGGYAMTAITAVTAQNTRGVQGLIPLPADFVVTQMRSVIEDIGIDAVKIGMLGSAEVALAVAAELARIGVPIVFDPVMVATSGAVLADADTIAAFREIMTFTLVTTPNLPELDALGGLDALTQWGETVLVKGGHSESDHLIDRLVGPSGEIARWEDSRIDTVHTHGTGCTLSSAIATYLGMGLNLPDAVERARQFVRAALLAAPGFGARHGPMGHQAVR